MPARTEKTTKAYKNIEFLGGRDARGLRILSEYVEPLSRFHRFRVEDTIVFFGSARVVEPKVARASLEEVKGALRGSKRPSAAQREALAAAEARVAMAHYYEEAVELARLLTEWSKSLHGSRHRFLVCSGGGPGIMEAANRGAAAARGRTIGLGISLPFEQAGNPYISRELQFEFHYFFMRKFWFFYLAKALVIFPGGFGTLDEMMEILTLLQTKKSTKKIPMVLYGTRYWREALNLEAMVRWGTIDRKDLDLIHPADTPAEAFEFLRAELTETYLRD